jgi:hypothetical protein
MKRKNEEGCWCYLDAVVVEVGDNDVTQRVDGWIMWTRKLKPVAVPFIF